MPEELAFREGRLDKIREAMAALEAEAQTAAEQVEAEGRKHLGVPDDKAQRNFTDAESRIMPAAGGKDFQQAYNCQAMVDHSHQVIVAARATNVPSDKQQAVVMIEEAIANTGAVPREVSATAGYYSAQAVDDLDGLGVDPFVAPEQTRHGRVVPPAPRGRIPSHLSPRDRMRRKLRTKRGRQRYVLRMATVEPVFGQIKQGRGFRQFLLRGLEKVQGEWSLIFTGHNLLKLFRFGLAVDTRGRPSGIRKVLIFHWLPRSTKPKPRWDVHLPGVGNRGGSLAGVFRPLIAGPSGSAVSPRLSGWTARPGICRPSPAPPPCCPSTDCQ